MFRAVSCFSFRGKHTKLANRGLLGFGRGLKRPFLAWIPARIMTTCTRRRNEAFPGVPRHSGIEGVRTMEGARKSDVWGARQGPQTRRRKACLSTTPPDIFPGRGGGCRADECGGLASHMRMHPRSNGPSSACHRMSCKRPKRFKVALRAAWRAPPVRVARQPIAPPTPNSNGSRFCGARQCAHPCCRSLARKQMQHFGRGVVVSHMRCIRHDSNKCPCARNAQMPPGPGMRLRKRQVMRLGSAVRPTT